MKPLIVANWKCNPTTLKGAKLLFDSIKKGIKDIKNVEVVICPPYTQFSIFNYQAFQRRWRRRNLLRLQFSKNIKIGAQDVFWEEKGAYTGEISPLMLKDLGCQYVIIGHSERRALGETDEMINKKLKAVLKEKLKPILCIGETEKERKEGQTEKVIKTQLKEGLKSISNFQFPISNLVIAYEPVWAIGTGKPCHPEDTKKVLLFLRKILAPYRDCSGAGLKENLILYGGSVNSKIAKDYIEKADFEGLLVGGASLDAQEFVRIVETIDLISK